MGVLETLPDRPLLFSEIEALDSELPAGFTIHPGSMLPIADTEMVPTAAVAFPDGSRTVVGYHPGERQWVEIERWDAEEFEGQEQTLAIETFADQYFAGDPATWLDTD